ncbi:RdgB/HAM1 family non-canonical purine NTP pyrophosphatase [Candidatus Uhrbacteria bacterium]|nr:RdgB/HAM1 family non-canonical purine NTP pyrophosphatase [Candidatus Uhrbacteria bacterium]
MKLIFATHNDGKVKEMAALLEGLPFEVISATDAGVPEDIEEDMPTFEGNALKKARYVSQKTKKWAIADDSGISIKALDGAPGVHSARWGGEDVPREQLAGYTLRKMRDIPEEKRACQFESALAIVSPEGGEWVFHGMVRGSVAPEERGMPRANLPYDTIFIPEGDTRTFAEMTDVEKNSMSHRGRAFTQAREFLSAVL